MSSLESTVTLEDVFAVVEAKRVPLAPELAGYLSLEIADGTDAGGGDVDPKTVLISEEGTVALVRPKRDVVTGEAESSIRTILSKLLDASGSATPALSLAAKRKPGNGLPALVEELEAALIPVNRSAGRRALARLARETKRVTMGVGRNASVPPVGSPARPAPRTPAFDDEAATVPKRHNPMSDAPPKASSLPPPPGVPLSRPPPPPPPPMRDRLFGGDEVESLLEAFEVSNVKPDKQVARDLKAMAGLSPTPPPPNAQAIEEMTKQLRKEVASKAQPSAASDADSVEALLALADASGPLAPPPPAPLPPVPAPSPAAPPPSPRHLPAAAPSPRLAPGPPPGPALPPAPAHPLPAPALPAIPRPPAAPADMGAFRGRADLGRREPRAPKTSFALLLLLLVVLVGAVAFVWWKAPRLFTGKKKPVASASVSAAPAPAPPRCKVGLVVADAPAGSEILLRMGQAPLDVERMPVGARLEFVGTAEGYAPKRAIVRADASWDHTPDGKPRLELPMQLDPSKAKAGGVDPWPGAEPGSQVGGSGPPGTVHVVSNVRGAEVWLLAGLGPEARIEQLACDSDIDVLLAGPASLRKRLHVPEKDIQAAPADPQGNRVVTVSAK